MDCYRRCLSSPAPHPSSVIVGYIGDAQMCTPVSLLHTSAKMDQTCYPCGLVVTWRSVRLSRIPPCTIYVGIIDTYWLSGDSYIIVPVSDVWGVPRLSSIDPKLSVIY